MRTLERAPRRDAVADTVGADSLDAGIRDFESKSCPVFDASTVCVGAVVGDVLEELVGQIAVGAVDLDTVKASLVHGVGGSLAIQGNVLLDFIKSQGLGVLIDGAAETSASHANVGR